MQLHTAAFAFTKSSQCAHLGQDDAIHRRHDETKENQQRRASSGGKRALKECLRWKASQDILKGPGACLVNANAAVARKHCICPERGHGRLSSSSARHRRRVVDPSDPPGAVNVASPTTAASSVPCLLLLLLRPCPRRACRASCLRSYPQTPGRSSFGN